jgi:hypothetical protein
MGDKTTIPKRRATFWQRRVAGPSSADSANSHHSRSRVQNANGMVHASCKQSTLHPPKPAAVARRSTRANAASRCSAKGAVVGDGLACWTTATRTTRGGRCCSRAAFPARE